MLKTTTVFRIPALAACVIIGLNPVPAIAQTPALTRTTTPRSNARVASAPRAAVLPGTRQSAFGAIQGNALDSTNRLLPGAIVRLRDARVGRIVETQSTDRAGLFAFRNVDPGLYVVDLLGADQRVMAASQLLAVNGGEALSAVVKLPFQIAPLAGLLGQTTASAATVSAAAAAAGVMTTAVTGQPVSAR